MVYDLDGRYSDESQNLQWDILGLSEPTASTVSLHTPVRNL